MVNQTIPLSIKIFIFAFGVVMYGIAQYLVLRYFDSQYKKLSRNMSQLKFIHTSMRVSQILLLSGLFIIVIEMVTTSSYNLGVMLTLAMISYLFSTAILLYFSIKTIIWISRQPNVTMIMFMITMIMLLVNISCSLVYQQKAYSAGMYGLVLRNTPGNEASIYFQDPLLNNLYFYSSILSFLTSLMSSAYLLRHYFPRVPALVYWSIFVGSAIYYVLQYTDVTYALLKFIFPDQVDLSFAYILSFIATDALGGILIGFSFLIAGKKLNHVELKNYLYLAGFGFILLFLSNYALNISSLNYPPFGVSILPYVALGSYLVFVGVYCTSISVAQDAEIRRFINRTIKDKSIISKIAQVENYRILEHRVTEASKKLSSDLESKTGVKTSMADEEIRNYINEVISELEKTK